MSSPKRVLFVTTRFPYPLVTGDRLRAYVQIKNLARDHDVTLACFSNDSSPEDVEHMREYCREIHVVPHSTLEGLARVTKELLVGSRPLQVAYFYSGKMKSLLDRLLGNGAFDVLHVHLIRSAEYVRSRHDEIKVLDMCDAMSLEYERRVAHQRSRMLPLYRIEGERLSKYEPALAAAFDQSIMISPIDAEGVAQAGNVNVLVNSVRLKRPSSSHVDKVPLSLIYTGYIGFYSDEMALVYFHRDVLPLIKERHPDVKLYIVGKSPSKRVQSMASDSVIVTGYVDSMEEYLRQSWVSISPMRVGAGLKNKVLEAFMYELPVVATSLANMGIGAVDRRDILIGDDPRSFANAVCELLEDPELRHEIGRNGRRYVEANFSDDVVRNGLHEIYARAESAWNARRTGPSVP